MAEVTAERRTPGLNETLFGNGASLGLKLNASIIKTISNIDNLSNPKASRDELNAVKAEVATKVSQAEFDKLVSDVDKKATKEDIDDIHDDLDKKADKTAVDALAEEIKAKVKADVDAVRAEVATKASQVDLDALRAEVEKKANASDVARLEEKVDTKASKDDVDSIQRKLFVQNFTVSDPPTRGEVEAMNDKLTPGSFFTVNNSILIMIYREKIPLPEA